MKRSLSENKPAAAEGWREATQRLQSADPQARWEAARQLAGFAQAVPELGRHLAGEPDERVREAIFTSLAKIDSRESFESILVYLRADDAGLRTAALDALKLMPEAAGQFLDALLHDPDPDIRVLACDLARSVTPASAQQSLRAVLASEADVNVCAAAIELLAEIGTLEILPDISHCAKRLSVPFLEFSVQMAVETINARSALPQG